jgi:hypothetical protein
MLVATLAASCGSDDRPGATATPPSTTIAVGNTNAATTVTATAAGQTLRGTGYSLSLPAGWRDTTTDTKRKYAQVDLSAVGTETKGAETNLVVIVQPSQGGTLPDLVAATRKVVKQALSARLVGEPERLSLAGTPAMAFEYTHSVQAGPLHGRQVLCPRDDKVYGITFVAHPQAFTTDRAVLDQILASWSWG